jgi:hypothetical protein
VSRQSFHISIDPADSQASKANYWNVAWHSPPIAALLRRSRHWDLQSMSDEANGTVTPMSTSDRRSSGATFRIRRTTLLADLSALFFGAGASAWLTGNTAQDADLG